MADLTGAEDDKDACDDVRVHVATEEFDSESFKLDMKLHDTCGDSNVHRVAQGNLSVMARLNRFLRHMRVSAQTFSTGFLFWYWPFYGTAEAEKIKQHGYYSFMQFGEHSIRETFVRPHYSCFKEEILGSTLISASAFKDNIVAKGDEYASSATCKKLRSCTMWSNFGDAHGGGNDAYSFEIPNGSPLKPHHLYAVIAYCDYTAFCTAFSGTFRKIKHDESVASVNKRNGKFYFCSRYLRELVTYYGAMHGHERFPPQNGQESGPFFTGMNIVLNLPQFKIGMQGLCPRNLRPQK